MRIVVLKEGALVVSDKEQNWLLGAPEGIKDALDIQGIEIPSIVFTTALRSPGIGHLNKAVLRFKEQPLRMNGLSATPLSRKHGTDYVVDSGDAKILFSERGDVSTEDTEGYHLAIIKNKHRSDKMGDHVITWPWLDAEYLIHEGVVTPLESLKVWAKPNDVPDNLKKIDEVPLTLEQSNFIARVAKGAGTEDKENWAIAISSFKKSYEKKDGSWVKKQEEKEKAMVSKEEANYNATGGIAEKSCANCAYYANGKCSKVEGDISPGGISDIWILSEQVTKEEKDLIKEIEKEGGLASDIISISVDKEKPGSYYVDFGDWAEDATKEAVKKVLGSIEYEMEAPPDENKYKIVWQGSARKEFVDGKPVPRIIDILTANLHKAYNDTSDHLFKLGYLSQDERLAVGQSIGDGLDAFRRTIGKEEFCERAVDKWDVEIPVYKEQLRVYKDKEGNDRWASISSVAMWDRQGEYFTTKAMDWAIAFSKLTGYKGPLRFKHVPGLDGGDCDTQFRIGDYLFESGTFRDNSVGNRMKEILKSSDEYQISLGLAFAKEDLNQGLYQRAAIFERSMTKKPAVPVTSIVTKEEIEMKIMTEDELKQAAEEFGMDLSEVKTMYERALASGNPLNSQGLKEALKTSGLGAANAVQDEDEEPGYTKEQMKEILESLSVAEFKELQGLIQEVNKADDAEEDEEEYEEMSDKDKMAKLRAKKKEDDRVANLETLVLQQTKAMESLAAALTGKKNEQDLSSAFGSFLSQLPREQANKFVSTQTKQQNTSVDDDAMMEKFKAVMEDVLKKQAQQGPAAIYDQFTSTHLNKGSQR